MEEWIMVLSVGITASATVVIAYYAWVNHEIASKIQSRDDEFRQEMKDLYVAMVLSNLLSSDSGIGRRKTLFEEAYEGKTRINLWKTSR